MAYLCGYEYFKQQMMHWNEQTQHQQHQQQQHDNNNNNNKLLPESMIHFMSGMMAETIACIIYVPVDVIKERLQVQHSPTTLEGTTSRMKSGTATSGNYNSIQAGKQVVSSSSSVSSLSSSSSHYYNGSWDALKKILHTEGLRGIYKGYAATLASFGPYSALYFVFYEQVKDWTRWYLHLDSTQCTGSSSSTNSSRNSSSSSNTNNTNTKRDDGHEIPFPFLVLCSASAGAAASFITSPLDMAKLRLQIQRGNNSADATLSSSSSNISYRGMVHCLKHTYEQHGIKGLFRGSGARVIHYAPSMAITMTCYEKCRSFYARNINVSI